MTLPACSVVIPTWNSARLLTQCLERIHMFLPEAKVIIVDRLSDDGTRDIAVRNSCLLLDDDRSLGSARMAGIRAAGTEWIVFIDDDVLIKDDFPDLFKYVDGRTGAVQGHAVRPSVTPDESTKRVRDLTMAERGYTNMTIVRRDLLLDLDISTMNAYEDWTISRHIIEKGYRWKVVPIYGDHLHEESKHFYRSAWNTYGLFRMAAEGHLPLDELERHYIHRLIGEFVSFLELDRRTVRDIFPLLGCIFWPVHPVIKPGR